MYFFIKLQLACFLTLLLLIAELVLDHFTHSLTLLVVAWQTLYNFLSLFISSVALALRNNNSKALAQRSTFGWRRVGVLGCMISLIFLVALCFGTTVESLQTFAHSEHLDVMHEPVYISILAGVDFLVWCLIFRLIGGYTFHQRTAIESDWLRKAPHLPCLTRLSSEEKQVAGYWSHGRINNSNPETSANLKTTMTKSDSFFKDPRHQPLNFFRDNVPCFILIITSILVYIIDQNTYPNAPKYIDPAMAIFSIIFLIVSSIPMAKKTISILMQNLPEEMENVDLLCKDLKETFAQQIIATHEVHVWCLVPNQIYATLHIVFKDEESYMNSLSLIHRFLVSYGISQATIQPEFVSTNLTDAQGRNSVRRGSYEMACEDGIQEYEEMCEEVCQGSCVESIKDMDINTPLAEQQEQNACLLPCPTDEICLKKRCCIQPKQDDDGKGIL